MIKCSLKQLERLNLNMLEGFSIITSPEKFQRIAESLDRTDVRWIGGCKPSDPAAAYQTAPVYRYAFKRIGLVMYTLIDRSSRDGNYNLTITDSQDYQLPYTVDELGSMSLDNLKGKTIIANTHTFKQIAKELGKVPGLRWKSHHKVGAWAPLAIPLGTKVFYAIDELGIMRYSLDNPLPSTPLWIDIKKTAIPLTLKELKTKKLSDLKDTYFIANPNRRNKIFKVLKSIRGILPISSPSSTLSNHYAYMIHKTGHMMPISENLAKSANLTRLSIKV